MQIPEEMVKNVVDILVKVIDSEGSALASVAMVSLGHIGLRCALPSINQLFYRLNLLFKCLLVRVY